MGDGTTGNVSTLTRFKKKHFPGGMGDFTPGRSQFGGGRAEGGGGQRHSIGSAQKKKKVWRKGNLGKSGKKNVPCKLCTHLLKPTGRNQFVRLTLESGRVDVKARRITIKEVSEKQNVYYGSHTHQKHRGGGLFVKWSRFTARDYLKKRV